MQLSREHLELQSLVEYFYAIDGVPTKGVKPEQLRLGHCKIFIQSTSQGSRCLTKGEKLLYLEEVNIRSPKLVNNILYVCSWRYY
jgi:hypothetical protein